MIKWYQENSTFIYKNIAVVLSVFVLLYPSIAIATRLLMPVPFRLGSSSLSNHDMQSILEIHVVRCNQ
ncbi:hypothetical protein P167DRAFT_355437 [Morchella conica CCBAS932]|uniref:Uncharacterized protein n=1 Tax=Morchella conica CCBAS932 TaxID=1392247 RepID=A0A3N4KFU0_9PEZI|nr:hypothetical protein P167DRAFT_355437 [Morchella conica CCBAS932]